MTRSVTISTEQEDFIQEMLVAGNYTSASEIISDALRLLQSEKSLESLRAQIALASASLKRGEGIPLEEVAARFKEKIKAARQK